MTVSFIMNFITIRHFGALGATYTSMAVYFLMAALAIFFVHKKYNLKLILGFTTEHKKLLVNQQN
jgi:O-antigen/teichoic acid export membrane protein